MKVLEKQIYRFGEVEIDPSRACLMRDGQEQYLRQKAFRLLLYLLEHRARLVTREELIEEIWEGTAVTDDALGQLVKEVRRILGDDPRQPRFIKTVPKAGYRFIGPVEELSPGVTASVETREITTVEVEYEEESPASPGVAEPVSLVGHAPARRVGRRPALICAAAVVLIAAAALAFHFRPSARALPDVTLPQVPGRTPVAVMYFENQSDSRDLDWLREGLADMLITDLSRSKRLTVLGRGQLHLLLDRIGHRHSDKIELDDALDIGRRSRAEIIVMGSFARLGKNTRINAHLYDAQTGHSLASESFVSDRADDLLTQIDLMSLKLAAALGAAPDEQAGRPTFVSVTTNNLDAYRYYSLAMEQVQMYQFPEAIELLVKATTLDAQFAMAYARVGYIYAVLWGRKDKAKPYLEKAFQLADRLTEKDRLYIAAWYANAVNDPATAIDTYQKIIGQYPMEVEAYQRLCRLLIAQRRFDEALAAIKQGLVIDPDSKDLYNGLGAAHYHQNRYEEAEAAYQRYVQLAPGDPNALDSLGTCHQAFGHYAEAVDAFRRAISINPESRVALIHLGHTYLQQGRYREAIEQYQQHLRASREDWSRGRSYESIATVYLKLGDLDRAEQAARKATGYYRQATWISVLIAYARGDRRLAERLKSEFLATISYADHADRGFLRLYYYHLGYFALKDGRAAEAIEHFKKSLQYQKVYWNTDPLEDCLANAYLELGQSDEALAEYERILAVNPAYALAYYHIARAHDQKGGKDKARAAYEQFLQLWSGADPDIPEVIAARRWLSGQ